MFSVILVECAHFFFLFDKKHIDPIMRSDLTYTIIWHLLFLSDVLEIAYNYVFKAWERTSLSLCKFNLLLILSIRLPEITLSLILTWKIPEKKYLRSNLGKTIIFTLIYVHFDINFNFCCLFGFDNKLVIFSCQRKKCIH